MKKLIALVLLSFSLLLEQPAVHAEAGLDVITVTQIQAITIADSIDDTTLVVVGAAGGLLYSAFFDLPGLFSAGTIPAAFSLTATTVKTTLWVGGLSGPGLFPSNAYDAVNLAMGAAQTLADLTNDQDDLQVFFGVPPSQLFPFPFYTRVLPAASEDPDAYIPIRNSQTINRRLVVTAPAQSGILVRLVEWDVGGLFGSDPDELGTVLIRNFPNLVDKDLFVLSREEGSLYRIRFSYERDKGKWSDLHPFIKATTPAPSLVTVRIFSPGGTVQSQAPLDIIQTADLTQDILQLSQLVSNNTTAGYSINTDRGYRPVVSGSCGGDFSEANASIRKYVYTTSPVTEDCDLDVKFVLIDSDGDGVVDINDAFPNDPAETRDSDSDGVGDNADNFPRAVTSQTVPVVFPATGEQGNITLTSVPGVRTSTCSLDAFSVEPIEDAFRGRALADVQVVFSLVGCEEGEQVQVVLDFGVPLPDRAVAYKIRGSGLARIRSAGVAGSKVTYTIADNGPLDSDSTPGVIVDPVAVFLVAESIPIMPPWLLAVMGFMLSLLAARGLRGA